MRKISVPDEGAESLYGPFDENLKHLETLFNVRIRTNGHELLVEGEAADAGRAEKVLEQLATLIRGGYRLGKGDVKTASQLVAQDENVELSEYFLRGAGRPTGKTPGDAEERQPAALPGRHRAARYRVRHRARPAPARRISPWPRRSRSSCPSASAGLFWRRPAVEAGEKLGFLPGDLQEKVNPYLRPLYDALYDMMEIERADRMLERGTIEVAPIAFMRGRTLNDAFVILDEAQNTTSEQMKMFLTRLGFGSKAVITGDVTQIDLPTARQSGLVEAMKVVGSVEGISFIHFDDKDVVRHPLVQQIVKAYEAYGGSRQ